MANRLAVVRLGTSPQQVVTFVRADAPGAPEGCALIPEGALSDGWVSAEVSSPVPEVVEARQLRKWLILNGRDPDAVSTAIQEMGDPIERALTFNEWEYATSYTRRHPMFAAFVRVTQMSADEIDQAFREAATL